jgi:glutathione S-transferase
MIMFCVGRFGFGFLATNEAILAEVRKSLNDEVIPRHLEFIENLLVKSTTGWIANTTEPSIADFILVPRLQVIKN